MYDDNDLPQQQYEQTGTSLLPHVVLSVLVAVVAFIAVLAAWTRA